MNEIVYWVTIILTITMRVDSSYIMQGFLTKKKKKKKDHSDLSKFGTLQFVAFHKAEITLEMPRTRLKLT